MFAQSDVTTWAEVIKGQVAQFVQLAEGKQPAAGALAEFICTARADLQLAEIRVTHGMVGAYVAQPAAVGAVGGACTGFKI